MLTPYQKLHFFTASLFSLAAPPRHPNPAVALPQVSAICRQATARLPAGYRQTAGCPTSTELGRAAARKLPLPSSVKLPRVWPCAAVAEVLQTGR